MDFIEGGVCAPKGFLANGVHCGIRANKTKKDLALIFSIEKCIAAGMYTQNLVCGAPVKLTKNNLENGYAQAVICNSGIANTCAKDGLEKAKEMCNFASKALKVDSEDMIVASTGVIGDPIDLIPIRNGMGKLISGLSTNGSEDAALAIMTTDTVKKEVAVEFEVDGVKCRIGGISKGSGMIHPNMATMLCFLTTDACIELSLLKKALSKAVSNTFNMLSIDGDTSTNDTITIMANGMAKNSQINSEDNSFNAFCDALESCCTKLVSIMAKDGEGATKLITCSVLNSTDEDTAKKIAKAVICSSLVKTAFFGEDANWGRILCAIGYSNTKIDVNTVDVFFSSVKGKIKLCENGLGISFSEEKAKEILECDTIEIIIDLKNGNFSATSYGCDLTYDYIKINGDYRT